MGVHTHTHHPTPPQSPVSITHTHTHPHTHPRRTLFPSVSHSDSGRPHHYKGRLSLQPSPAGHTQPPMCWPLCAEERLPREGASRVKPSVQVIVRLFTGTPGRLPSKPLPRDELPHQASVHTNHLERTQRPAETSNTELNPISHTRLKSTLYFLPDHLPSPPALGKRYA